MFDVVALGECLIDFTPAGTSENGIPLYSQNPGGAPANVLAMATNLGARTAFIGKVGADGFGYFLKRKIEDVGVDCSNLILDKEHPTTLAFVTLDEAGDRSFSFYRDRTADVMINEFEVDESILDNATIFHFGSVSMTAEPSRSTTLAIAKKALGKGCLISFDPNYRPLLWKSREEALEALKPALAIADILKVSEEEMLLITGKEDFEKGSKCLQDLGAKLVVVTAGAKGAFVRMGSYTEMIRTYDTKTIDTTGAGDAFWGSFLYQLIDFGKVEKREDINLLTKEQIRKMVMVSNAAGSLTTEKKGAIPAMPKYPEIAKCMENVPLL